MPLVQLINSPKKNQTKQPFALNIFLDSKIIQTVKLKNLYPSERFWAGTEVIQEKSFQPKSKKLRAAFMCSGSKSIKPTP